MTEIQQFNLYVSKPNAEQVLLKSSCIWPTGQEEWSGDVEVRGGQKAEGIKNKQKLSRKQK
jgi:hypothetical protein